MDIETATKQRVLRMVEKHASRLHQLEEQLADPAVIADKSRYPDLVREHGRLSKLAAKFEQYRDARRRLQEAESILQDDEADAELKELATEELSAVSEDEEYLADELISLFAMSDSAAAHNVIVEIRAGTGGDEAALFAADLLRMYTRYAERQGWKTELMDASATELGGFKEVVFSIEGDGAYEKLRFESGGHRVQRIPETEAQGRIHTSLATVAVMPEAQDVDIEIRPEDIEMQFTRSQGPGGQKVNKTSSCVRIVHKPTGMAVRCQDEKSQHRNRTKALKLLRSKLYELEQSKLHEQRSSLRRNQVGSGDRSERIRTYNFPQDRVTDHRIGMNLHGLDRIMMGELDALLEALGNRDIELRLKSMVEEDEDKASSNDQGASSTT